MSNDVIQHSTQITWLPSFIDPSASREHKPRQTGLTMIMDKGLGLQQYEDILNTCAAHIDFIKLGFGTSVLYPTALLQRKIQLAQKNNVTLYPGGTFFEIAFSQNNFKHYLQALKHFGFDTVEISDGTICLHRNERNAAIRTAKMEGFKVITECGSKERGSTIDFSQLQQTLEEDLSCGAKFMIVEGRETGQDVGIYNEEGELDDHFITHARDQLKGLMDKMIWEAPQKHQQVSLIKLLGTNVNLGNIHAQEVIAVESLRRGLRSDTFTPLTD